MINFCDKYHPTTLESVVYHDTETKDFFECYVHQLYDDNLVLYGTVGTGKNTIAEMLPQAIVPDIQKSDVVIISCPDTPEIEKIKKIVPMSACSGMNSKGMRIFIFSEAHNLQPKSQQYLQVRMETHPNSYRYIFTTNHISKINKPILSRCRDIQILPAKAKEWLPRSKEILLNEGLELDDKTILNVLKNAEGDNRKILQSLQDVVVQYKLQQIRQSKLKKAS